MHTGYRCVCGQRDKEIIRHQQWTVEYELRFSALILKEVKKFPKEWANHCWVLKVKYEMFVSLRCSFETGCAHI